MDKQIKLYSVDTRSFYNTEEQEINNKLIEVTMNLNSLKDYYIVVYAKEQIIKLNIKEKTNYEFKDLEDFCNKKQNKHTKKYINTLIKSNKDYSKSKELQEILAQNEYYNEWTYNERKTKTNVGKKSKLELLKNELETKIGINTVVRNLIPTKANFHNEVATFDSDLVRMLKLPINEITTDIIIIRALHYSALEQLVLNGFDYTIEVDGVSTTDHYIFYTASAGQVRKKKSIFMKESVWKDYADSLTNGLSREMINNLGGISINKWLAYLSLQSSSTDEWEEFDIDKAIVVPDYFTNVTGQFDYIEKLEKTRTIKDAEGKDIEETYFELQKPKLNETKTVKIEHSDGCGLILEGNKNFQFRLPWFKGLLSPCSDTNVLEFCDTYNESKYITTDIYSKVWI